MTLDLFGNPVLRTLPKDESKLCAFVGVITNKKYPLPPRKIFTFVKHEIQRDRFTMKEEKKDKEVNEPAAEYSSLKKKITVFSSFEAMEEHTHRALAALSYEERLCNLETLRKRIFNKSLLPNGNWPPLSRKLTITKLPYEVCR